MIYQVSMIEEKVKHTIGNIISTNNKTYNVWGELFYIVKECGEFIEAWRVRTSEGCDGGGKYYRDIIFQPDVMFEPFEKQLGVNVFKTLLEAKQAYSIFCNDKGQETPF